VRRLRWLTWPLRYFRSGYWMRLWLVSTEQQGRLLDRVRELEAEADHNARSAIRFKAESERLALELRLAQAFAGDGYEQARRARVELAAARKSGPGTPSGDAGGPDIQVPKARLGWLPGDQP